MNAAKCKFSTAALWLGTGILFAPFAMTSASGLLDDRSRTDLSTPLGSEWRFVSDRVMGGVSQGKLVTDERLGRSCLHLSGNVSKENNGGFIQMALPLSPNSIDHIEKFEGIVFSVTGNGERYGIHLKTSDLWLPWQSYRAEFTAGPQWQRIQIPFDAFQAYRTKKPLKISRLSQLGLVAIGREFTADLCLSEIGLYPDPNGK